jgi:hypothetical protein
VVGASTGFPERHVFERGRFSCRFYGPGLTRFTKQGIPIIPSPYVRWTENATWKSSPRWDRASFSRSARHSPFPLDQTPELSDHHGAGFHQPGSAARIFRPHGSRSFKRHVDLSPSASTGSENPWALHGLDQGLAPGHICRVKKISGVKLRAVHSASGAAVKVMQRACRCYCSDFGEIGSAGRRGSP